MHAVHPVHDPDDPRIAAYRHVRERDLVGREGLFIAEGEVVVRRLAESTEVEPVSLLLAQKRLAGLGDLVQALPVGVEVYVADQGVMDAIVGFPIHRGILALGRRRRTPEAARLLEALPAKATVLAVCGIANHDNMGGLFRNAAAFGVDAVLVDHDCCDPLYRKAIRVSVGAALTTPFARLARGEDMVSLLEASGFQSLALSPAGKVRLTDLKAQARRAVLVGAEGPGLPRPYLERSKAVAIPMAHGFDSLNVATTAGIVLHHLRFVAD